MPSFPKPGFDFNYRADTEKQRLRNYQHTQSGYTIPTRTSKRPLMRLITALLLLLWVSGSAAVEPEPGWYWVPGEPGRGYFVERQDSTVAVGTLVYDEAGNPEWYVAAGPYDGEMFSGELLRFAGGQCLGCDYEPPDAPQSLGIITVHFRFRSWALVTLGNEEFWMQRHWFGTDVIIATDRGRDAIGQEGPVTFPSLLGRWIFINDNNKPPIIRSYNFTEMEEIPSYALDMGDQVLFTDPVAGAIFICTISVGYPGWEHPFCGLLEGDVPFSIFGEYVGILAVGFRDIGLHGMLAYEDRLVDFGTDRGEKLIIGIRVE